MSWRRTIAAAALLPFALTACDDDGVGVDQGAATVALAFTAGAPATASAAAASAAPTAQQELVITGTTGDLVLTDVFLIVSEFELERAENACVNEVEDDDDACEEFEANPFLLELPLGTGIVEVVTDEVPLGTYTELGFEVEDLDLEDEAEEADDAEFRESIVAIRDQLVAEFPEIAEIPAEASLFVRGRFQPTDGAARPFTTLFEAEIEVEEEFVPALVIDEVGANRLVTVNLDPAQFFRTAAGEAVDLSQFDFNQTGELVEFELEFEQGFEAGFDVETD